MSMLLILSRRTRPNRPYISVLREIQKGDHLRESKRSKDKAPAEPASIEETAQFGNLDKANDSSPAISSGISALPPKKRPTGFF